MIKILKINIPLIIIFIFSANSFEIKSLVRINNENISNYDLDKEIKLIEKLENRKVSNLEKRKILNNSIDLKVKKIELDFRKIEINEIAVKKKSNLILKKNFKNVTLDKEIRDLFVEKITIQERWNKLIVLRFGNKLEINLNEIAEIINTKNLSEKDKDELINLEKDKKINLLSNTFFNQIKKKYLIKIL